MFCTSCGIQLPESSLYCSQCGAATSTNQQRGYSSYPARSLKRSRDDKKVGGVCAGIARYLGVDVVLVRILTVCLAFWPPFPGLIAYLVCWMVMPIEPIALPPASTMPQDPSVNASPLSTS